MDPHSAPPGGEHRYQLMERLGQGGMGEVWLARDRALDRKVALKFLRGGDPDREGRLLLEAQRQARVSHPGICTVYEAGILGDRGFIAMELIPGPHLGALHPPPTHREAAALLAEVAEAVHAAHLAGLVHRDLKPGNILLRPLPEGGWRPVVADFGLAREVDPGSLSASAPSTGTPAFMAPEQILGDRAADARSDVYGLGATLYALLSGHPPFVLSRARRPGSALPPRGGPGGDAEGAKRPGGPPRPEMPDSMPGPQVLEVLRRVVDETPDPLRRSDPAIPRALELIVAACLEKAPERRYPSAKALAEDLRRFLAGEPVLAQAPSLGRRLHAWGRRHPSLATAAVVAGLAGTLASLGAWRLHRRAAVQAAQAQRLGQGLEELDQRLRLLHMSPRHDTRPGLARIQEKVGLLRSEAERLGAPGAYALGRARLLLGELDEARRELDRAWSMGFKDSECAKARGLTLLRLYQRGVDSQWQVPAEERDEYRARLERDLREPARELLSQARGTFLQAQWSWLGKDEAAALSLAAEALKEEPWAYEAWMLQYRIWRLRMKEALRGRETLRVAEALRRAETALQAALDMAPSDGSVLLEQAAWNLDKAKALHPDSHVDLAACEAAEAACNRALEADPGLGAALLIRSEVKLRKAILHPEGSPEAARWRGASIQDARAASATHTRRQEALGYLATLLVNRARFTFKTGGECFPDLEEAVAASAEAMRLDPTGANVLSGLSRTRAFQGQVARAAGRDPRPYLQEAVAAERKYMERRTGDPRRPKALARALMQLAEAELDAGGDETAPLQEARRVLKDLPPEPLRVELELQAAEADLARGRDAAPALELARALLASRQGEEEERLILAVELETLAARLPGAGGSALARAELALHRYARGHPRPTTLLRLREELAFTRLRLDPAGKAGAREGLAAARALLKLRPLERRARALEGLFLLRLQGPAQGLPILQEALARDPLLAREFAPYLKTQDPRPRTSK